MSPLVQRHIAFRRPQSVGMPRHALRRRMANGAMPAVFTAVAARWGGYISTFFATAGRVLSGASIYQAYGAIY